MRWLQSRAHIHGVEICNINSSDDKADISNAIMQLFIGNTHFTTLNIHDACTEQDVQSICDLSAHDECLQAWIIREKSYS